MQVTLLGAVLLPLSLVWINQPIRLLQLVLLSSVFEAAAAMIFGGFGLQPAMVPALLLIGYLLVQYALGMRYAGEAVVLRTLVPLLALLIYALLSAWLLPDAFAGRLMVEPQKFDPLAPGVLVPLQFNFGNVTQSLYLSIDIVFTIVVAIFLTRAAVSYRAIIAAYLLGGYLVVAITVWQFASRIAGIPFPDEVLQSNPSWAIVEQAIGSVPRVQGPFSEPAALASYMSGIAVCCLWLILRGYTVMRPNLLLALAIVTTLLSTSTTGIVTLAVALPLTFAVASVGGVPGALRRTGRTVVLLALGGLLLLGPVLVLKPTLMTSVNNVIQDTLNKRDSDSYTERSASDAGAMATLVPTFGLGVGWGSYRSSSLIPGLLANGGVFTVAMVVWLLARVVRLGSRGRAASPGHAGQILVDGFSAALCCQLVSALISAPMITSLAFYLQLGAVIGVLARMTVERPALVLGIGPREPGYLISG